MSLIFLYMNTWLYFPSFSKGDILALIIYNFIYICKKISKYIDWLIDWFNDWFKLIHSLWLVDLTTDFIDPFLVIDWFNDWFYLIHSLWLIDLVSGDNHYEMKVGAASKGIIQRDFQHHATVYKSPYAKVRLKIDRTK